MSQTASDTAGDTDAGTESAAPLFSITSGNPTAEEVAALTIVLAAAASSAGGNDTSKSRTRGWSNRARTMPGWASTSGWGNR